MWASVSTDPANLQRSQAELLEFVLPLRCGPAGQSSKHARVGENQKEMFEAWCYIQCKPAEHWLRALQLRGVPHATGDKALKGLYEAMKGGSTWPLPENKCSLCPHEKTYEVA